MHQPWAPDIGNWNYNDRFAFLRVKNEGEKSTYMENRVPSSAANPYLVMAATLAAGIDGVIHKMSPPVPHDANAPKMPSTLSEAINALEADTGLVDILGKDFVKYFIGIKREIDLEKFEHHDVSTFIMEETLGTDIKDETLYELFWIFFPSARNVLHEAKVFNPKNASHPISFDHLLNARRFSGVIVREENVYGNRKISDYVRGNSLFQLLEADKIKEDVRNREMDMWNY